MGQLGSWPGCRLITGAQMSMEYRKYGAGKLWFTTRERISLKIIHNLGTCPEKCLPALFSAEGVERISVWIGDKLLACPGCQINGHVLVWPCTNIIIIMSNTAWCWLLNKHGGWVFSTELPSLSVHFFSVGVYNFFKLLRIIKIKLAMTRKKNNNRRMPKIVVKYRLRGRRRLGRSLQRLLAKPKQVY